MEVLNWLLERIGEIEGIYAYLAIFSLLMACGLGLPLPEDITLIAAGLICFEGNANTITMVFVSLLGVMGGDTIIFMIGSNYGNKVLKSRYFARFLSAERLARAQRQLVTRGNRLIFFARFMPGLRAPIFFTAGTLQLPFKTFFFFDGFAAFFSVPAIIYLTHHFGEDVENVFKVVRKLEHGIFVVVLTLITILAFKWWLSRRKTRSQDIATQNNEG